MIIDTKVKIPQD